jgi:putative ABC transport system permease protein
MKKLFTNKLIITVLCIVIGMAPLVAFVNTAESGKHMLRKEFGNDKTLLSIDLEGISSSYEVFKKLSAEMSEINDTIPISRMNTVLNSYKSSRAVTMKAVGSSFYKLAGLKMLKGKFITKGHMDNNLNVVVIDDITADELFGTTDVLGRTVEASLNGISFETSIIGICKRLDITEKHSNQDQGFAYIPITMLDNNFAQYDMQQIVISTKGYQIEEAKAKISHFLSDNGVIVDTADINFFNQQERISLFIADNKLLLWAIAILWFIAAILGITNIMLVDIERRKKYYALLSFYGNESKDIQGLILCKSYYMALYCSLISMIIGITASFIICKSLNIPAYISIHSITLGIIIPIAVCLLAAIYPAHRGTNIDINKTIWQLD